MQNLFNIPIEAITQLSAESAIRVLRSLLHAEVAYAKLKPSNLTISQRLTVADGGIDAEINGGIEPPNDCFFSQGVTGYQIKSGASFKPWTKSAIEGELLDGKKRLYPAVAQLLERSGNYVVLCTGHDLTPQQRNNARDQIKGVFERVGFSNYPSVIDVLGASQIAEYAARYPGVAAMLGIDAIHDAWVFQQWALDSQISNDFKVAPEQQALVHRIQASLRDNIKHIRVLGEPGLGKTRLVFEALRNPEFISSVLYVRDGSTFGQSALFRSLVKTVRDKPLIVVLDDLPEFEMADVWRHLKGRCGYLRLISLDHGQDSSQDEEIVRLHAPRLPDATIKAILIDRAGESIEIDRWIVVCEGSPRVAQAVGDNLRANPEDLLKPPSTVPIWDRFLHGYGKREELPSRQIDCVASYLALFSRFGYESPVQAEAVYIAKLVEEVEPTIGLARFRQIVTTLRERRVLQGSKTLFFVPKALHIYLWKHFWVHYGTSFRFTTTFQSMPESMHVWFMNMFKYAGGSATSHVIDEILSPNGTYADAGLLTSAKGARFLSTLAEANPAAVLSLLERTVGTWPDDYLLNFKEHRQNIVWTLEKIAVWSAYSVRALNLLACLARNENADNSNNATGTLLGLFRIGPEWAATEASPQQRIPALFRLLRSSHEGEKHLALGAMKAALDTRGLGWRMVGPEYQGMKERAKLWIPATHGDWWDAQHLYFSTLIAETASWNAGLRKSVCAAWLEVAEQQITIPRSTELAFATLEQLMSDPLADASKINRFFSRWLEYRDNGQHGAIATRLRQLQRRFVQRSLISRFQRYVIDVDYGEWNEDFRERRGKRKNRAVSLVTALAKRVASDYKGFTEIQALLAPQGNAPALWHFGEQLAEHDSRQELLQPLIALTLQSKHQVCLHAYLSALRSVNPTLLRHTVSALLSTPDQAWLGATIVVRSDFEDDLFGRCLDAYRKAWIDATNFRALRWGRALESLPKRRLAELLTCLHDERSQEAVGTLIDLFDALPFTADPPFTAKLVFDTLVTALPDADENWRGVRPYDWKDVCSKLIAWDSSYAIPLLEKLLEQMATSYELTYDFAVSPLATELLRQNPAAAWSVIAKQLEASLPKWRSDLLSWLKGGHPGFGSENEGHAPIAAIDLGVLLKWIDVDAESRSVLVAHAAPRTLNDEFGGALTRELITRYGHIDGVKNGISCIFHAGSWSGPTSLYLRGRREKFRAWLAAGYPIEVTQWIESEIEYLDRAIEREEIDEERSRFD